MPLLKKVPPLRRGVVENLCAGMQNGRSVFVGTLVFLPPAAADARTLGHMLGQAIVIRSIRRYCIMANNFAEADKILDRIRADYNSIAEHLPKAVYLRKAFEDRYLEALRTRVNLVFFLKGEADFLEGLLNEAEVEKGRKAAYKERNQGGFAQDVLKKMGEGISDYPLLASLDSKCITEVSRLYGAVNAFLKCYWEGIAHYMRGINPDMGVEIDRLERSLSDVYSSGGGLPPKAIRAYNEMVSSYSGTGPERIRAAQDSIRFAGIWLNNLKYILNLALNISDEDSSEDIRTAGRKLTAIIKDFRLMAFAKRRV
ncbi:hypothetical protein P0082_00400 [Candidatus Haliotispira prima]|uniref:Uncharacterized protein n=1 Tax=Candidatus Haliotispira prima TaxID=3034016 RepID=A0ABY8MH57_9SPIO|nr:hypothetical protein P0082_00400 [Candidatus Haliotispira prima]